MVVNIEPTVAASTPTPVEMHHVVVIIAVKDVSMSTTAMRHGPIHINRIDNQLHICFVSIALTVKVIHLVGVKKVLGHCLAQFSSGRTAAGRTVVHIHRNACMVNQLGHSLDFHLRRTRRDGDGHVVPIVGSLTEVDRQRTVFWMVFRRVGVTTLAVQRMVPVFHYLGGSGGHTASVAMSPRTTFILWAEVVVRIVLVPFGLHEVVGFPPTVARDETTAFLKHGPVSGDFGLAMSSLGFRHDTQSGSLQIIGQGRSHVVRVESALVGIADKGAHCIVGGHNDKARRAHIEHVVAGLSPIGIRRAYQTQVGTLAGELKIGHHERLSQPLCCFSTDRPRQHVNRNSQSHQGK